jgi:hypothetical protein
MSIESPTPEEIAAKDKTIRTERRRLKKLLEDLDEGKKKAADGLIDECAFMRATLIQYRECITTEGLIDIMSQGDYTIKREHPAVRSYVTMIQKYASVCKQLFDMLPARPQLPEVDDFDEFRKSK